ncbi:hypothetical protein DFH09DRAFT_1370113 [Mycena vulgaris]|nr:hypothetical protein DFH09DRAFT_1370113 [Mycena vulgaris]
MATPPPRKFQFADDLNLAELQVSEIEMYEAMAKLRVAARTYIRVANREKSETVATRFASDILQHIPAMGKRDSTQVSRNAKLYAARIKIERGLVPGVLRRENIFGKPANDIPGVKPRMSTFVPPLTRSDVGVLNRYLEQPATPNVIIQPAPVPSPRANVNPPSKTLQAAASRRTPSSASDSRSLQGLLTRGRTAAHEIARVLLPRGQKRSREDTNFRVGSVAKGDIDENAQPHPQKRLRIDPNVGGNAHRPARPAGRPLKRSGAFQILP